MKKEEIISLENVSHHHREYREKALGKIDRRWCNYLKIHKVRLEMDTPLNWSVM